MPSEIPGLPTIVVRPFALVRRSVRRVLRLAARRPRVTGVVLAVLAFALAALLEWRTGPHYPWVQDEFAHLLAADTFLHGRLANPAPPIPEFFEAPHVLVTPSYVSKYPPGQGLLLALGTLVGGRPIVGMWIAFALATGLLYHAVRAWTSTRWGVVAALLYVAQFATHYWTREFWGAGHATASAGALLALGLALMIRRERFASGAAAVACGLVGLALTRPFEGLFFSLPLATAALFVFVRSWRRSGVAPGATRALPALAVLVLGAAGLMAQNAAVTGDPLTLPYQVHAEQYQDAPLFHFQDQRHLDHPDSNPRIGRFYSGFTKQPTSLPRAVLWALVLLRRHPTEFLLAPALLGLLLLPCVLRRRSVLLFGAGWLSMVAGMQLAAWNLKDRYAAAAVVAVLLIGIEGLRLGRTLRFRNGARVSLTYVFLAVLFAGVANEPWAPFDTVRGLAAGPPQRSSTELRNRRDVERRLVATPGPDLVFVGYHAEHSLYREWVYNGADLQTADIVWAHDLGDERNEMLRAQYPDRSIWYAWVSGDVVELSTYAQRPR